MTANVARSPSSLVIKLLPFTSAGTLLAFEIVGALECSRLKAGNATAIKKYLKPRVVRDFD
jgi:hypothetical protein